MSTAMKSGFVLPSPYTQEKNQQSVLLKDGRKIKAVVRGRGGKNPANSGVCVVSAFSTSAPGDECRK